MTSEKAKIGEWYHFIVRGNEDWYMKYSNTINNCVYSSEYIDNSKYKHYDGTWGSGPNFKYEYTHKSLSEMRQLFPNYFKLEIINDYEIY